MTSILKTYVKRYDSLDEMKADEYRYWQRQPGHVRLAAISKLSGEAYGLRSEKSDVPRLQRPFVQLKRK